MIAKYKNKVFPSGMVGLKRVRVELPDPRHTIEFDSLPGLKNWLSTEDMNAEKLEFVSFSIWDREGKKKYLSNVNISSQKSVLRSIKSEWERYDRVASLKSKLEPVK